MATVQRRFVEDWVREKPGRMFAIQYDPLKEEYVGSMIDGGKSICRVRRDSFAAIHVGIAMVMKAKKG